MRTFDELSKVPSVTISSHYRTKMKIQSQALQEKFDKSQRELNLMRKEMTELKKELTELKALLLLHKDCAVSRTMTSTAPKL
jgi:Skp family chaperone for outer membrane proteins